MTMSEKKIPSELNVTTRIPQTEWCTVILSGTWSFSITPCQRFTLSTTCYSPTNLWQGNVFTPVCHSVPGGCLADTPQGRHPSGQTPPPGQTPPADGYCSGWYASYWNAFLCFREFFGSVSQAYHETMKKFPSVHSTQCWLIYHNRHCYVVTSFCNIC